MKTMSYENHKITDYEAEGPFFSFSHLAVCFPHDKSEDADQLSDYGFLSPQEDILYETGILFKSFMKC